MFEEYRVKEGVEEFLKGGEHLIPTLREAPGRIRPIFGERTLDLACFHDPEDGEDSLFITVILDISESTEEVMDMFTQVMDWWCTLPIEIRQDLSIHVWYEG